MLKGTRPRRFFVPVFLLLFLVLFFFYSFYGISNSNVEPYVEDLVEDLGCEWIFSSYQPSSFEALWVSKAEEWGQSPCDHLQKAPNSSAMMRAWVEGVNASETSKTSPSEVVEPFSKFVYKYTCTKNGEKEVKVEGNGSGGGEGGEETIAIPIEPLAVVGRHPYLCNYYKKYLVDKSYLLLDWRIVEMINDTTVRLPHDGVDPRAKSFYFDVGASLFDEGKGGASQRWVYDQYGARGVHFDGGWYAWEANEYKNQSVVWEQVPKELAPRYHWFNVPVTSEVGSELNPLTVLKRVANRRDFVVFKIDIDTPLLEEALVLQILADRDASALIDEFYFEYHYKMKPMTYAWARKGAPLLKATPKEHWTVFTGLRQLGIRAHVWV